MKQLYVVEITDEIIVLADSREEAEKVGLRSYKDEGSGPDAIAHEMTYLPGDWDKDSLPYGESDEADPDRTVGEWIEMGAAPQYKERKPPKSV